MQYTPYNKYKIKITGIIYDEEIIEYIGWADLSTKKWDTRVIDHNIDRINKYGFSRTVSEEEQMEKYVSFIDWDTYFDFNDSLTKDINLLVRCNIKTKKIEQALSKNTSRIIATYYKDNDFIDAFSHIINWDKYCLNFIIPDYLLERYWEFVFTKSDILIEKIQQLPISILRHHYKRLNWTHISKYQKLSKFTILEFSDRVDWLLIFKHQKLDEDFIINNCDRINCGRINCGRINNCDKSHGWKSIVVQYQSVSEKFILDHLQDYWPEICRYQNLSYDFMKKYQHLLSPNDLVQNKHLRTGISGNARILTDESTKELFVLPPTLFSTRNNTIHFAKIA